MASIVERPRKTGEITYQVRWREGGTRGGKQQSENFGDRSSAQQFKALVDAHGQHWPRGWVRGVGFQEEDQAPHDVPLVEWVNDYVEGLPSVEPATREYYRRLVRLHFTRLRHRTPSGEYVPATVCNVTAGDIADWVRQQQRGSDEPGCERRPAHPRTIAMRHSVLYAAFQAAVDADLRLKNPCRGTRLPRLDVGIDDEMCFLERDEYARLAAEITDPDARDLMDWLVGTGMRWGEATALQVRDVRLTAEPPTVSVQRSWKRLPAEPGRKGGWYLGPPKTKKSRRTLALTAEQVDMVRRRTVGKAPESLIFTTKRGNPWRNANFHERRWQPAVEAAIAKGLPKRPRIHDLRHTHVAWLIAAGVPMPAIQARLGHESYTTTADRYGHLVRELDGQIVAAVEAAMPRQAPRGLRVVG